MKHSSFAMCYEAILVFNAKRTRGFHSACNKVEIAGKVCFTLDKTDQEKVTIVT